MWFHLRKLVYFNANEVASMERFMLVRANLFFGKNLYFSTSNTFHKTVTFNVT